jgi:hypothetical protein
VPLVSVVGLSFGAASRASSRWKITIYGCSTRPSLMLAHPLNERPTLALMVTRFFAITQHQERTHLPHRERCQEGLVGCFGGSPGWRLRRGVDTDLIR